MRRQWHHSVVKVEVATVVVIVLIVVRVEICFCPTIIVDLQMELNSTLRRKQTQIGNFSNK